MPQEFRRGHPSLSADLGATECLPVKGRESGMPPDFLWEQFFDADQVVEHMECVRGRDDEIVEFGCGYGTFTIPLARRTSGIVHALDIEPELVEQTMRRAGEAGLSNVRATVCDFVAEGSGLADGSADHALLFNLLHIENPVALLREAFRNLKPGGTASIIHWKFDPSTPRGPSMHIWPRPEQCRSWAEAAGLDFVKQPLLGQRAPHHYGLLFRRPDPP